MLNKKLQQRIKQAGAQDEQDYFEHYASEKDFLNWYHQQQTKVYPRPSVTADFVGLRFDRSSLSLQILLIKRKAQPFRGKWALPGGFLQENESVEQALVREVKEETDLNINLSHTQLLPAISTPNRDPRMWVITNPSIVLFSPEESQKVCAGDDAQQARWFDVSMDQNEQIEIKAQLAFDHIDIIKSALQSLKRSLNLRLFEVIAPLLGQAPFTIQELQRLVGAIDARFAKMPHSNFYSWSKRALRSTDETIVRPTPGRRRKTYQLK